MASMAVNELGPMLTATEVADMLHLHVNTVKRLGDRGELPFYRVCKRGDRRFRLDDVMKFLVPEPLSDADRRRRWGGRRHRICDASPSARSLPERCVCVPGDGRVAVAALSPRLTMSRSVDIPITNTLRDHLPRATGSSS